MTALRSALADYLGMRRALGYKLRRTEKLLLQFVDYIETAGADHISTDLALNWARLPASADVSWWSGRLTVARKFATFVNTLDPKSEVPPADLLPARKSRRAVPFLYSDSDIAALVEAAQIFPSPLRVLTCQTWIQLLAVTGMRVGEAIRLDRKDLDFEAGVLTVWMSKFGKSRELPLHPSTVDALRIYLRKRDQLCPNPSAPSLFISSAGTRLLYCNVNWDFIRLVRRAGLMPRSKDCRPRIHDLRHTFAVRTIIDAYQTHANAGARLSLLSTYLGHVHPGHTYWYLSAAPELLGLAGQRLERSLENR
ncbi:MAG TPA: tyrosine-type recombinase/integrase [Ktedonobacterales bacterium]|nr:tyrosine-type recombinase/integrase [Ktedonobacterales bacterium]